MKKFEIPSCPGYFLDKQGRIYSNKAKNRSFRLLKPYIGKLGYYVVSIIFERKRYTKYLHRLIAEVFISDWNVDMEVNHKDFNRTNNSISNLEMCTHYENIRHAQINNKFIGESRKNYKFSTEDVKRIRDLYTRGLSTSDIAQSFGASQSHIWNICNWKTRKNL